LHPARAARARAAAIGIRIGSLHSAVESLAAQTRDRAFR
jgi:hypothetical protein